jgi:hypothetical protein
VWYIVSWMYSKPKPFPPSSSFCFISFQFFFQNVFALFYYCLGQLIFKIYKIQPFLLLSLQIIQNANFIFPKSLLLANSTNTKNINF